VGQSGPLLFTQGRKSGAQCRAGAPCLTSVTARVDERADQLHRYSPGMRDVSLAAGRRRGEVVEEVVKSALCLLHDLTVHSCSSLTTKETIMRFVSVSGLGLISWLLIAGCCEVGDQLSVFTLSGRRTGWQCVPGGPTDPGPSQSTSDLTDPEPTQSTSGRYGPGAAATHLHRPRCSSWGRVECCHTSQHPWDGGWAQLLRRHRKAVPMDEGYGNGRAPHVRGRGNRDGSQRPR
jgi:hypothetical protein